MLKSIALKFISLCGIFSFCYTLCTGQSTRSLYSSYLKSAAYEFRPANFLLDQRFEEARNLPQIINVKIEQLSDIENLLNHHIVNNIYGISLVTKDSINFDKCIGLLVKFPNLQYLQIDDIPLFGNYRKSKFQLPEAIKLLSQLKLIEFYGNKYLDMPDAISKLSHLKNLTSLSFVSYPYALPQQMADLVNIRSVKLSTANLEGLELNKVNWQLLKLAGTSPNMLNDEAIIKKLTTVKSLNDLTLEYCALPNAKVISKFKNLQSLAIYSPKFAQWSELFTNISALKDLQTLFVAGVTDTTEMLTGIETLKKLKSLELRNFISLKSHPEQLEGVGKLKRLQSLELQSGDNIIIPDFFKNLKTLKSLTIGGNDLSKAINSIFLLPSLDTLILAGNELSELPDLSKYACTKLKVLNLQFNKLVVLPRAILNLPQLEILNLANNKLKEIPTKGWEQMTALRNVNFNTNQITEFPGGLQLVKKLMILDLSHNKIGNFPELDGDGYQLKSLIITGNQFAQLPLNIGKFNQLEVFWADFNKLISIPASLGDCKQLKQLKLNNNFITSLPEGLKDTKNLGLLNIGENPSIDPTSVFNVLLSMPRKYLSVDLSKIGLLTIPADEAWKTVSFVGLNLNGNKLTALPVQFAEMKSYNNLTLNNNPLGIDPFICNRPIKNKSDMKILYEELGTPLQNNTVSNAEYAIALAERVSDYYWSKKYSKAITYANKATSIDSTAYKSKVDWDEIGICRFKIGDYKGAIRDFDQFIIKESKRNIHWGASLDQVEQYKSDAHQALGEKDKAADTHIYFAKHHNHINGFAQASVLYKELGNDKRAKELMDTVLLSYQERTLANEKYKNPFDPSFIVEYAEILIIADQFAKAIELLNSYEDRRFPKNYIPIKNYLLSTAMYLHGEKTYEQAESDLIEKKNINGKVTGWSFDMFNNWMKIAIKSEQKKTQLLALQKAATI
ncbi:MAG: hypothetical protein P0Y49_15795 [Candidatus Pedobacter colombiensis]|uniref:Uncharacterized protein n=1 Tax=Candidatus Pedobacter colombiensis TaxID=3121371 RepID=A0AAJ5W763_9SPHI|nr:hypothetical protein [Pedobacter sp.]WEK18254.1 MAG: hypothetical protein P0Y49_15795 [Pedobacter sp.]